MDIHESPVTRLNYYSDCPVDLIAALTLVGRTQRSHGVRLSDKVCIFYNQEKFGNFNRFFLFTSFFLFFNFKSFFIKL